MFKRVLLIAAVCCSMTAFAAPPANCNKIATFTPVVVLGGTAPKCVSTCPTVRPPQCADVDGIFPIVLPKKQSEIGDYTAVVCGDISTFPVVTKPDGSQYPKCVQKCQGDRPPKCVDYNSELQ